MSLYSYLNPSNSGQIMTINTGNLFVFEVHSKKKIVLISIKNNLKTSDVENLGANFYNFAKSNLLTDLNFLEKNIIETKKQNPRIM